MKVLELFCGTKSISKAFAKHGHETFTVDWEKDFNPSLCADIGALTTDDVIKLCGGVPDVIWASPDCTTFSVAAISKHRSKGFDGILYPISAYAKTCDAIDAHVIKLIEELKPKFWFIENPRGGMRKASFMRNMEQYRHTVTYCQYGDTRMKPTDIWTNIKDPKFKPPCNNGDPCHESAPRGSQTGTQGRKGSVERARIPEALCEHIVSICEENLDWTHCLVKVKPEWLAKDERDVPYVVLEDRGTSVLVSEIRPYAKNTFLGTWCWAKDTLYIIDDKNFKEE